MPSPNILLITVHDLGWADLGCYGNPCHLTPNLDRLAAEGARFTQAYAAAPICNPSRFAILTGQYPARHNLTGQPGYKKDKANRKAIQPDFETEMPGHARTIGHELQAAGYRCVFTGVIGPELGGRDLEHFGFEYIPADDDDKITDEAIVFIKDEASSERPFYLQVNYNRVHTPLHSQEDRVTRFQERIDTRCPWRNATYGAVLEELDDSVGRILEALDNTGKARETVVTFLSDHGGYLGFCEADIEEFGESESVTSNHPLREGKASLYEGGIRIPWILRWPTKAAAGRICDTTVNQIDIYPTLMQIAGRQPPSRDDLDGQSLLKLIRDPDYDSGERTFYWHWPHYRRSRAGPEASPSSAVRSGDWKLIEFFEDGRTELYNLADDVGERNNLAKVCADERTRLHGMLRSWRTSVNAQMPVMNPEYAKN